MPTDAARTGAILDTAPPPGNGGAGPSPMLHQGTMVSRIARLLDLARPRLGEDAEAAVLRTAVIAVVATAVCGLLLRLAGWLGSSYGWFTAHGAGVDSWGPMIAAYGYNAAHPGDLYGIFFAQHVKFQYPPSALGIIWALEVLGIRDQPDQVRVLNAITWVSLLATPVAVYALYGAWVAKLRPWAGTTLPARPLPARRLTALALAAGTLVFWPVMMAWSLGQLQTVLNLLFVVALLAWVRDRQGLAGALIGLICASKPQFGLFLLWGAAAGAWRFVAGQALVCAICLGSSLLVFGIGPHLGYLAVLSYIGQHGETYAFNQSVNGILNRIVFPDAMQPERGVLWQDGTDFAPFNRVVALATSATSLVLIAVAGINARRYGATAFTFCFAAVALTMASPVAWDHHYGVLIGVFAVMLGGLTTQDVVGRTLLPPFGAAIMVCFLGAAIRLKGHLPGHPLLENILVSHLFLAALGLLVMLWRFQAATAARPPAVAPARAAMAARRPTPHRRRRAW